MNVLLMNDNKKEQEKFREILTKRGFNVSESNGGFRMLEDMSRFKKDLVVLDYGTWRRNRGIYRYFGVEKAWVGVPVIVVGASEKEEVFGERHPHEKDAIVSKPVDENNLNSVLDRFAPGVN